MKNHETMSITNESLLKTTRGHKLKVLEPLCNQTVDLETDDKTLCCSILKTNTVDRPYIDSCLNLSTQKPCSVPKSPTWRGSTVCILLQTTATKIKRTGHSTKKSSNRSMALCVPRDTFHELFWSPWDPKNHKSIDFLVEYPVCVIPVAAV